MYVTELGEASLKSLPCMSSGFLVRYKGTPEATVKPLCLYVCFQASMYVIKALYGKRRNLVL